MRRIVRMSLVAICVGCAIAALAFVVFPGSRLTELVLAPGAALVPILGPILPSSALPGDGPAAAVVLILAGSLGVWCLVSVCIVELAIALHRRPAKGAA